MVEEERDAGPAREVRQSVASRVQGSFGARSVVTPASIHRHP